MKEKIESIKNAINDLASELMLKAKENGTSEDKLKILQEQIFQIQTNLDKKRNGLSEQEQSINKKKLIKISLLKVDIIYI